MRPFINCYGNMRETELSTQQRVRLYIPAVARPLLFLSIFLPTILFSKAQDVLIGMTSNGGPEGGGTAFSIKSTGAAFAIINRFANWGKTANGDLIQGSDGNFYGMTYEGGTYNNGTIFRITSAGVITIVKQFNSPVDGGNPYGTLIRGADGNFYGLTSGGGTTTYGTIFKLTLSGSYTVVRNLSAADGANPHGHLILAKDGNYYGITNRGGAYGYGTIFKMTASGTYTVLRSLNKTTDGGTSYGSLTQGKDGNLYGATYWGGTHNNGTVFKITTSGTYTVLHNMNGPTDGQPIYGDLIQATDGNFYGICYAGGTLGYGTIFKVTPSGTYTVLHNLAWQTDGSNPYGHLLQNSDGLLYGLCYGGGAHINGVFFKISTSGTYTVLHAFTLATEGAFPKGGLIKGSDGKFYGLTTSGGSNFGGTAFKLTTTGTFALAASFNGATIGNAPFESLVKGKDSAYYGTTSSGGKYNYGTIVKICGGTTTLLFSFNRAANGGTPKGSLLQATDGNFYGMTVEGGTYSAGVIFKITPTGSFTVLRHLNSTADGGRPQGSLVQGKDGNLYGMTNTGGKNGLGTIFKISVTGTFTVLRHLTYTTDGSNPEGSLVQGTDGNFYGMTYNNAHVFKISSAGTFTALHTFVTTADGNFPAGRLVQSSDGNFYGTTSSGGTYGGGTVFKISATGTYSVLKHFNPATDGKTPKGNLVIGADKNFYGLTSAGGTNNAGTVFKLTPTGTYSVLRQLTLIKDGGSAFGSLVVAPVNTLVANAQSVTTAEDVAKTIVLTGSGSSSLSYTITTLPENGTLSGSGASRTYTPKANYNGRDSFYVAVRVGCFISAPAKVNITITAVNDAPVLTAIGNKTVVVNTTLIFTATATDVDAGQTRKFSLITPPSGATINATTGSFTWKPGSTGTYTFKVRVTDNGSPVLYDEEQITVKVTAALTMASLHEPAKLSSIFDAHLYPNPVLNKTMLSWTVGVNHADVSITDAMGRMVYKQLVTGTAITQVQLAAEALERGTYILMLQTQKGNKALLFIKQ